MTDTPIAVAGSGRAGVEFDPLALRRHRTLRLLVADQPVAREYELAAGTSTLFCIVRTTDGEYHDDQGMRVAPTVAE